MPATNSEFFADRLRCHGDRLAVVTDSGVRMTYADLASHVERCAADLLGPARLIILEAANTLDCITAYLACLKARLPIVLAEPGSTARDDRIAKTFSASQIFRQSQLGKWGFESLDCANPPNLHPDLCILLSTSGTTGSPKLVRLSRSNIESNARAIANYLEIDPNDRAITTLPPFYSFGMSVLNSHLIAGATLLLTEESVAKDEFWHFFNKEGATTFSAVPFTFDVLDRIGFRGRSYPSLRHIVQAGGRLSPERVSEYAHWGARVGTKLFIMYGQTEASPRMAYVPPHQVLDNAECIGVPIPGGAFELIDECENLVLAPDQPGELVYRGPNVMMGYAEAAADLAAPASLNELRTGDIACRKQNGLYYIVGRKSRFSKIVGLRVSLDEIERWANSRGFPSVVSGDDQSLVVATGKTNVRQILKDAIVEHFGLPVSAVQVLEIDPIPTLPSGKYDYRAILRMGQEAASTGSKNASRTLIESYREILGIADIRPTDSFLDLGGDSVNFVEVSLLLEAYLGYLPENWEASPISSLEALRQDAKNSFPAARNSDDSTIATASPGFQRRFFAAAGLGLGLLLAGEAALQLRAYLKTGRSAAAIATGQTAIVTNKDLGLVTYRPNFVIRNYAGKGGKFETNSLGLRSPEITIEPAENERRIIVAGASTVAGAYAKLNDETFPALLEKQLQPSKPEHLIRVVNAGVEGYSIVEIEKIIDRMLIGLRPSILIVYPGLNDMAQICRDSQRRKQETIGLPTPTLPDWVLTKDLISKNTVVMREPPLRAAAVNPEDYFPSSYRKTLETIVTRLEGAGIEPVLVTVARAFQNVDRAEWRKLAETALFYNPCLDLDGLSKASELFNQAIVDIARRRGITLIDLGGAMPGGSEYFVDSSHFTLKGERFTADFIHRAIISNTTLAKRLGLRPTDR